MSTVIAMYNLLEKSDASIFNCIIMDFKIGDIVNHRDYGDTLFEVVYISRGSVMIYSNEWNAMKRGHSGTEMASEYKSSNKHGHYYADEDYLTKVSSNTKFSIGDTVLWDERTCKIVGIHPNGAYILYCEGWSGGHNGTCHTYKGNGDESGHYFTDNVKLINSHNEVRTTHQQGIPRGSESTICSKPLQIASSSRPVGSPAADIGIEFRVATGSLNNNRIQLNQRR